MAGVDGQFRHVAPGDVAARVDAHDHVGRADALLLPGIQAAAQVGVRAELFHDLDQRLDDGVGRGGEEVLLVVDILRADAEDERLVGIDVRFRVADAHFHRAGQRDALAGKRDAHAVADAHEAGVEKVHLRRADQPGDEFIDGIVVQVLRGVRLLHEPLAHDDDAGAHRHRLDLVVGDVEEGGAQPRVQLGDLGAHLRAQAAVQIGERLVQQKDLRLAHERAAERDALALPGGERLGLAHEAVGQPEHGRRLAHAAFDVLLGDLAQLEAERHVVVHRQVGGQRVPLREHRHVAVLRFDVVDLLPVDIQLARGDLFQPGDHAQHRRFAAPGRADQHDELAVADIQAEIGHRGDAGRVHLPQPLER